MVLIPRRISPALTREQKLDVVSIEMLRIQARIDHTEEDDILAWYLQSAYDTLSGPQGWLNGCCLLTEEFEVTFGGLERGSRSIELPVRPLQGSSVTSFEAIDADNLYTPVPLSVYNLEVAETYPVLTRSGYAMWPYFGIPNSAAYRVRFAAGFGDADDVPTPLKHAILLLAAHWYKNREAVVDRTSIGTGLEKGLDYLCRGYRLRLDHS